MNHHFSLVSPANLIRFDQHPADRDQPIRDSELSRFAVPATKAAVLAKGTVVDPIDLSIRLDHLRQEHSDLDAAIAAMAAQGMQDQLAGARLKKRKLRLKDEIARIEAMLIPDIIA